MNEKENVKTPLTDEEIERLIEKEYSDKSDYTKDFIRKSIRRFGDEFYFHKTNRVDNNLTKVIITCKIHGDFEIDPQYFLKSKYCYGCPKCHPGYTTKMDLDSFQEKLHKIHPQYDITENSVYTRNNIDIELHCTKHNIIFYSRPSNLLMGKCGCPECNKENKILSRRLSDQENFKNWLIDNDNNITLIGSYTSSRDKVSLYCNIHNISFDSIVNSVYKNNKNSCICPECRKELQILKNKEKFKESVKLKYGDRYNLDNISYINEYIPITGIICNNCGEEVSPILSSNFLKRGRGCGCYAPKSRGEQEISRWLVENNINFKEQYKVLEDINILSGRTDKSKIIIDFKIERNNTEYWIECNGEQHYTWIPYMHTLEEFEGQLRRDNNIRNYCSQNNIILVEIPIHLVGLGIQLHNILNDIFIKGIFPNIQLPEISYNRIKGGGKI